MSRSILDLLLGGLGSRTQGPGLAGTGILKAMLSGDGSFEFSSEVQLRAELPTPPAPEVSEEEWVRLYGQLLKAVDGVVCVLRSEDFYETFGGHADVLDNLSRHLKDDHDAQDFAHCEGSLANLRRGIEFVRGAYEGEQEPAEFAAMAEALEAVSNAGKTDAVRDSFYGIPISGTPADVGALKARLEAVVKDEIRRAQMEAGTREGYVEEELDGCQVLVKKDAEGEVVQKVLLAGSVPPIVSAIEQLFRSSFLNPGDSGDEEEADAEVAAT